MWWLSPAQRATWCHCEPLTLQESGESLSTGWRPITRHSHRCSLLILPPKSLTQVLSFQTARVEECSTPGSPCPLVPACYDTHCVQVGCHVQAIFMLKILFSPRIYLRHKAIFMLLKILFLSLRNRSTTGSWCTTPTTSISRLPLRLSSYRPAARATMEPSSSLIKVFSPPRL